MALAHPGVSGRLLLSGADATVAWSAGAVLWRTANVAAGRVLFGSDAETADGAATFSYQTSGFRNLLIQAVSSFHVPVVIKQASGGQTANLLELWDDTNGVQAGFSNDGALFVRASAPATNCSLVVAGDYVNNSGIARGGYIAPTLNNTADNSDGLIGLTIAPSLPYLKYNLEYLIGAEIAVAVSDSDAVDLRFVGASSTTITLDCSARITNVCGAKFYLDFTDYSGTADAAFGIEISQPALPKTGRVDAMYGLYINQIYGGYLGNYAIFTNGGLVRFGDQLTVNGSGDRAQLVVRGNSIQSRSPGLAEFRRTDSGTGIAGMLLLDTCGSGSVGDGGAIYLIGNSATASRDMGRIQWFWYSATDASRQADLVLSAYDTVRREGLRIRGTGSAAAIGLYGVTPVARATTSGSAATFVQGSGNAVNDASTFDGYTLKQVVKALRYIGVLT